MPNNELGPSKQSCDQCYARRKKCDRGQPCSLCAKSDIPCSYVKRAKKRGPKGRVIESLRGEKSHDGDRLQEHTSPKLECSVRSPPIGLGNQTDFSLDVDSSLFWTTITNASNISGCTEMFPEAGNETADSSQWLTIGPTPSSTSSDYLTLAPFDRWAASDLGPSLDRYSIGEISSTEIEGLLRKYYEHIHPCYPLVDQQWVTSRMEVGEHLTNPSGELATMVLSMCGLAMAFISHVVCLDQTDNFKRKTERVISNTVSLHYIRPLGNRGTNLEHIITTFHLGLYFAIVHGDEAGHFRLAEAAHLAKSMRLHQEDTYLTMDPASKRRCLTVFACVISTNRACELRQGMSEIIHTGHISSLANLVIECEQPNAEIGLLYDLVTPSFSKCARGQCDLDICSLTPQVVGSYARQLDSAGSIMSSLTFRMLQPILGRLEETRWIEFLVGHRWLAAHLWNISVRHSIDMSELEDGKYDHWPLQLLSDTAQVLAVADIRSIRVLGNGLVHRVSYIGGCGLVYLSQHIVAEDVFERANEDLKVISDIVTEWDPTCWTRCMT